jgi:hypothetical protein
MKVFLLIGTCLVPLGLAIQSFSTTALSQNPLLQTKAEAVPNGSSLPSYLSNVRSNSDRVSKYEPPPDIGGPSRTGGSGGRYTLCS